GEEYECTVFALDPTTGANLWWFPFCADSVGPSATAAVSAGVLFDVDWNVHAMNPMSGALRWTSQAGGQFGGAGVAGLIYAASNVQPFTQGDLRAIDSHSSNQVWDVTLPGLTLSTPAVANGVVYLGCSDHLRAFDGATGAQLWQDPVVGAF